MLSNACRLWLCSCRHSQLFAAHAAKDKIELLLSLGATRWEATRETVARCVKLALTPILNQMNVVVRPHAAPGAPRPPIITPYQRCCAVLCCAGEP